MKPVIGIVGGIGSGKSTIARILGELGCGVFDSDKLVHETYRQPVVIDQVVTLLGKAILGVDGHIDRKAVAKIIFADESKRRALESIVHPLIEARRRELMHDLIQDKADDVRAFVIDSPLLLEGGLAGQCDAIVYVEVSRAERLRRLKVSRGWDEAELDRREKSQWPLESKRRHSTHVVSNEQPPDVLRASLRQILEEVIVKKAAEGS